MKNLLQQKSFFFDKTVAISFAKKYPDNYKTALENGGKENHEKNLISNFIFGFIPHFCG